MTDIVAILALTWGVWVLSGMQLDQVYTESCKENVYMETLDGRYACSKQGEMK